jgi:hypothetical protein
MTTAKIAPSKDANREAKDAGTAAGSPGRGLAEAASGFILPSRRLM